jgi:anti-sigma factor RsiW
MNCEWREKTGLYIDGELEASAEQAFAGHLENCAGCSAAVLEQQELKKAVRLAGKRFSAPAELHAAIYRQIRPARSLSVWWKWLPAAAGLALVVALALLVTLRQSTNDNSRLMASSLVDQHINALASPNPVDVQSPDTHKIRPWFQGRVPFTFFLPNVEGSSFALVGAKQVFVQQRPAAQIFYTVGGHKVSVFILQANENGNSRPSWKRDRSFNSCTWREGGMEFHMITDASQNEAYRLAEMFEQANRS